MTAATAELFLAPPSNLAARVIPGYQRIRDIDLGTAVGSVMVPKNLQNELGLVSESLAVTVIDQLKRFVATQFAMGKQILCPSLLIDEAWHAAIDVDNRKPFDNFCRQNFGGPLFHPATRDDERAGEAFDWTKQVIASAYSPTNSSENIALFEAIPGQSVPAGSSDAIIGQQVLDKTVWSERGCWVPSSEH